MKKMHRDPKSYVLFLLFASHMTLVVSAAPVGHYTNGLADGSSTAKTLTIPSSTSGNSDISSILKEVAKLAPGTTVINVNVGDKSLNSLLLDASSGATTPSSGEPGPSAVTGGLGDAVSGDDGAGSPDGTGGTDGVEDDSFLPGAPAAVGDGTPGSPDGPGFDIADGGDGDMDTTNSDSLVDSATQDGAEPWKLNPATGSDSPNPRSNSENGTIIASADSNSTTSVSNSSYPSNGTSDATGEAPTNGTSILKISIENTQKITIEQATVVS